MSIGRASSPEAAVVSHDLRLGSDRLLTFRRRIGGLSLGAMASMGVVAAYQLGLLRRPPEPRMGRLDAAKVDAAPEAYELFKTPDAALGLVSYSVTLALAGMGDRSRARTRPWLPLVLAAKVALDAVAGVYLTVEQGSRHRCFCSWCLAASAASVAMVPHVLPEAVEAWRQLHARA